MTTRGLRCLLVLTWLAATPAWAQDAGPPPPQSPRASAPSLLSAGDRRIYQKAFGHARAGRYDRARARAETAEVPLPAKIIQWMALRKSKRGVNFTESVGFLRQNPDWPNQAALRRGAEASMPQDLADREVLDWFQDRPPLTTNGALRFAEALSRAGANASDQATALLRRIWIGRDLTNRQVRSFRKRFAGRLRREDEIARLDRLMRTHRFTSAKRQARRLGGGYPALVSARRRLATGRSGVDAAIRRVPAALQNDPGLIFERARWRKRRGLDSGAIALLDGLIPSPSQAERWWPLRRWAARKSLLLGDASAAYRIAAGHGLDSGIEFAEGEWLAGWIALRFLDSPVVGFGHFTRLYGKVGKPISLARAAFWAGEAAQAIDQARIAEMEQSPEDATLDTVRQWYATAATHGTTFYGQLARQRLGRAPSIVLLGPASPDAESRAAFDARELVRVVRILGELGEATLQKKFLRRLGSTATTDAEHALVAELAMQQGRPDLAFGVARAALSKGFLLPDYLFHSVQLPEQNDVEPALVLALIRQESGFYTRAISRAKAQGLMQILPSTAKRVARRIGVNYSRRRLTADPDYNLRLGLAYLSDLIQRHGGSYILALAAYNAGPLRIDQWIRQFGDPRDIAVNPIDWIERIPFMETRNYVQRVLEGMVIYRQLSAANVGVGSPIWHFSANPALSVQEGHRAPFRERRRAPRTLEFPPG